MGTLLQDITFGRGTVFLDIHTSAGVKTGEVDFGEVDDTSLGMSPEDYVRFSTRSGMANEVLRVRLESKATVKFKALQMTPTVMGLFFMGDPSVAGQVADDSVSGSVVKAYGDRYYRVDGSKNIGVWKLNYDGGTAIFTVGKTLTGATGSQHWTILRVQGNATSGTLYLGSKSGATAIINDEVLSDNNTVPGAAIANGVVTWDATDFVVKNGATFYTKTTDFTVDSAQGRIYIVDGGTIADETPLTLSGGCASTATDGITAFARTAITGTFRFVSNNPGEGIQKWHIYAGKVAISASGDLQLQTGKTPMNVSFSLTVQEPVAPDVMLEVYKV